MKMLICIVVMATGSVMLLIGSAKQCCLGNDAEGQPIEPSTPEEKRVARQGAWLFGLGTILGFGGLALAYYWLYWIPFEAGE